jgi:hypothetical protein
MPVVATVGVAVARLCLARGDAGAAAELLGAADTLRGAPDPHDPDIRRLTEELRHRLGAAGYGAAHRRGQGLDRAAALALLDSAAPAPAAPESPRAGRPAAGR